MSNTKDYTEAWLNGPQGTAFYTRTYTPPESTAPKAVIVAVHGFAEHVGRYTHFHPTLAKQGVAVFAYDQRGFGLTALDTEGNKSKTSAWGKTCWEHQMEDVDWAVKHAKKTFEGTPIFLLGHSMGGGEALGFACQEDKSPYKATVGDLAGIIATSPLITQTSPAPKLLRWAGSGFSVLSPWTLIPAEVKPEDLSHDEERNAAYMKDPLIKMSGSLRGISDMLSKGEDLLKSAYKRWPEKLPLLLVHGTEDKVTNHKSSETFVKSIGATDKKLVLIEGGYHELQNEPDGVKERLANEIVQYIEAHVSKQSATPAAPAEATPAEPSSETSSPAPATEPESETPPKASL